MDEKHKELLKFHRTRFLQSVDIDRLIPLLQTNGVLSNDDVTEVRKYSSSGAKAEKLLDLLPSKGSQAFQAFCLALETTYPHLLTVMFLGGNKKISSVNDDLMRNSPSSAPQSLCAHQDVDLSQNILKPDLHVVNSDRDVWRRSHSKSDRDHAYRRLTTGGDSMTSTLSTLSKNHGVSTSDHSLNANREHDTPISINDSHHRYTTSDFVHKQESSFRESDFYHPKKNSLKMEEQNQRHETIILKKQYNELLADKHRLEQEIERLKRFREEDRKEVNELQRQQQEMLSENGGEAAHQLYLNALRKCEAMKEDYDNLHKRYADLVASHSATVSKLEVTQEELSCWRKRYEDLAHERNAAMHERNGLQQQCTAAIRQWDNALRERNEAREQLAKVQQQRDEAMKEINQAMAVRIKATKDLARLTEERNAAVQEYSLIMSERDTVHKEMERLQEELTEAQKIIKNSEGAKKVSAEEVESLKREISSALQDRDKALKECNDIREKYGDFKSGRDENQHDKDWRKRESHWDSVGRDLSRNDRDSQWDNEKLMKTHGECMDDLDQANREIESLHRQVERLQAELVEAHQEAEVCKRRRDWAFSERDKIVLERESIRSLCDKLRKERDRAVSDLAEALRDSDDVKKQKNEASKELKELREKMEEQLEKESRMKQLNSVGNNHSRDSAIDADMQEWDTETVEVALKFSSEDDLGLEFGGGKIDNLCENPLFVRSIAKGSRAEGKLKVNDCIVRINNIDVANVDRKTAIEAIRNCDGSALLVVKRRKATNSRGLNHVILSVHGGKQHGLAVENGVYISRIQPGSVAAREGSIAVGDRLLSINGKSIESVESAGDILDLANSTLTLQVSKCVPCPGSPPNSVSGYSNSNISSEKKSSSPNARDSNPSSPGKESVQTSPKKSPKYDSDFDKSLSSSQKELSKKSPHSSPLSPITRRRKAASDDRTKYPSSQPTLLDRAYNRIFGEKRPSKDKKNSPNAHSPLLGPEEDDPIAELDSVLESHSKMMKNNKENSKKYDKNNGGTWPKYKGPLIQYDEVGTVARYPSRKKNDRKSLISVNKQFNIYNADIQHTSSKQHTESHMNHMIGDCSDNENSRLSVTMNNDRIQVFVDCGHGHKNSSCSKKSNIPVLSPSANNVQISSSGSSYASPDILSPHKSNISDQSDERLGDMRPQSYNGNSSPSSLLDYSVVSAYPNKDVLEYYKNRNCSRPRSALFGMSDSECLSSLESNSSSQCSKNLMSLAVDRTSITHSDGIPLSFSSPDRPLNARSGHMYPVTVPTSLTAAISPPNLLRSSTPFYTLSTGQRGITHSHHPHNHTGNHGNTLIVSPSSRYSSPPGLSVYTSRSGDSLLSVSVTESMLVDPRTFHNHPDNGRYSLKDSGRHSFTLSPSPCPSQYSYSNPSPTQSIDLQHYHHNSSCQTPRRVVPTHSHVRTVHREDSYSPSAIVNDGLVTHTKRTQRIRIPSNPSVTSKSSAGKVSSSSIEKTSMSERSSPVPPFTVEWQNQDGTPQAYADYRGRIPKPGDLRSICIDKSNEPLGIQISCGAGGGIFVSSVTKNSLAAQAGLQIGDHLLEVCGINMRSATYGLAANVLRQCTESITMLVQYNPEIPDNDDSSDGMSPCETPVLPPKLGHSKSLDATNDEIHSSPSSAASTLTKKKAALSLLPSEKRNKSSKSNSGPEARLVLVKNANSSLGISLVGGNAVGVFVHAIQDNSPALGANGLRSGDQILEYNGVDLRHATAEAAAYELAKPAETAKILTLYDYERYQQIKELPGDSFYIRAMFDRMSTNGSLAFQKDDILYVDNTMYNGVPGLWEAWLVDEEGEKIKCGFIPSKYKVEEELTLKKSIGDLEGADGGRRGSATARRSFFRRKRHHRSNSRDSKELASFSDVSINSCSDSGILGEESVPLTYQRVEKKHYVSPRPVIIVGPLNEAVADQLEQEYPHVFHHCIPEKMKGSLPLIDAGHQDLEFVDFRRRGTFFECTTVSAIKQICDKNCHAILDVSLSAVGRLNQCTIYPIVIFLKFKSTKQIREVKDSRYLSEKVTMKAAKEMYEHAMKLESEYKHLISAVIPGSNLAYMCTQIKSCVEDEQSKALWVAGGSL